MIRQPTEDERKNFTPLITPEGIEQSPEDYFRAQVAVKAEEYTSKGKPYAINAAIEDWKAYYRVEKERVYKKLGFLDLNQVKQFTVDLKQYGDEANFEIIDQGEKLDDYLSKRYQLNVYIKWIKYKYKGYFHTYTIMEDGLAATNRARKEQADLVPK